MVHPHIHNAIDIEFDKISQANQYSLFIVDAALIYESGYDAHLDYVIVITAQLKHRMEEHCKEKLFLEMKSLSALILNGLKKIK
ncbi:MAG: hypothetical protein Ct9H90mP7_2730 [Candidatus Neomarinimicrobiota bacterium]|nr:MAG: hypothetical protein Ct9H90mP7_2730 [Candidatus Neomarinimicrobiota bacterium]